MASTVTVTAERSASGGTLRNDRVSQRRPDWPSVGSCRLSMLEPKSKTDPPGYCKLALQTDQLDPSNKVKQTSTFTCLPSLQPRSARTSMPFVAWNNDLQLRDYSFHPKPIAAGLWGHGTNTGDAKPS